jgi:hypothetical protein
MVYQNAKSFGAKAIHEIRLVAGPDGSLDVAFWVRGKVVEALLAELVAVDKEIHVAELQRGWLFNKPSTCTRQLALNWLPYICGSRSTNQRSASRYKWKKYLEPLGDRPKNQDTAAEGTASIS